MNESANYFTIILDNKPLLISRLCPHRKGRLDHGNINSKRRTIVCPLHNSVFCLKSGRQLSGPECGPISILAHTTTLSTQNEPKESHHEI